MKNLVIYVIILIINYFIIKICVFLKSINLLLLKGPTISDDITDSKNGLVKNLNHFLKIVPHDIKRRINNLEFLKKAKNDAEEDKKFIIPKKKVKNSTTGIIITPQIEESDNEEAQKIVECYPELIVESKRNIKKKLLNINAATLIENYFKLNNNLPPKINNNFFLSNFNDQINMLNIWKKNLSEDEQIHSSGSYIINNQSDNHFDSSLTNNLNYSNTESIKEYIILQNQLNYKQTKCLRLFLKPLDNNIEKQILLYLSGDAGTGKSKVISAIQEFFDKTCNANKIFFCAPTGSAAYAINGDTIHRTIKINSYLKNRLSKNVSLSSKSIRLLQSKWKSVQFLVIDEISMISLKLLNNINQNLQLAKNNHLEFGGIHILFVGDFLQLPVVSGLPLYTRMSNEINKFTELEGNNSTNANNAGRNLWINITHSIVLTEQMRQSNDKRFHLLLTNLRNGYINKTLLEEDYKLLKSRIIDHNIFDHNIIDQDLNETKIIVPFNSTREQLNLTYCKRISKKNSKFIYYNDSIDTLIKNDIDNSTTKRVKSLLENLEESHTSNLMKRLPLIENAHYFITHNISTKYGIVNGTEIELINICNVENEVNEIQLNENEKQLNRMPKFLLVKIINSTSKINRFMNGLAYIEPKECIFSVNPLLSSTDTKSVTVKRIQFPMTPANSLTAYKAQGKTIKKLIIDLTSSYGKNSAYSYVALSRAKCLNDILILRNFKKENLIRIIPKDLLVELERLKILETNNDTVDNATTNYEPVLKKRKLII